MRLASPSVLAPWQVKVMNYKSARDEQWPVEPLVICCVFSGLLLPSYIGILGYSKVEHGPCFNRDETCPTCWSLVRGIWLRFWSLCLMQSVFLSDQLRLLILLETFQFVPRIWQQKPTSTILSGCFFLKPKVTLFSGSPTPIHLAPLFGGSRVQLKNLKQNHGNSFFGTQV